MTPCPLSLGLGLGLPHASSGAGMDPAVAAYIAKTGIDTDKADQIAATLADLRAYGIDPAFLWFGGTDYNQADQLAAVIGGDGVVGRTGTSYTTGPNYAKFNAGTVLKFPNPLRAVACESYLVAIVYEPSGTDDEMFGGYNSGASGVRGQLSATGEVTVRVYNTSGGTAGVQLSNFLTTTRQSAFGWRTACFNARPDTDSGGDITIVGEGQGTGRGWISPVSDGDFFNDTADFHIGSSGDISWLGATTAKIAAVIVAPSVNESYRGPKISVAKNAVFGAGIVSDNLPIVVSAGDSIVSEGFGYAEWVAGASEAAGIPCGGQWTEQHWWWDNAYGGHSTWKWDEEYELWVKPAMQRRGGAGLYYCATADDADEDIQISETHLKKVEADTGATIIFASYHQGYTASTTFRQAEAAEVASIAASNGWIYVPLWEISHSQVYTSTDPTEYGFYVDVIHPSEAGRRIRAQVWAAAVPHPTSTGPRWDLDDLPEITGTEQVGETLSVDTGTCRNSPDSYAYQWMANLTEIVGATSSSYTLTASEEGKRVCCRVTAMKSGENSSEITSDPTGPIAAA